MSFLAVLSLPRYWIFSLQSRYSLPLLAVPWQISSPTQMKMTSGGVPRFSNRATPHRRAHHYGACISFFARAVAVQTE
jgi:hypothetical protein